MHKSTLRFCTLLLAGTLAGNASSGQIAMPDDSTGRSPLGQQQQSSNELPEQTREYTLAPITVTGASYLDQDLLRAVAGLDAGMKVTLPNDAIIAKAIRNLWKQDLFADVSIQVTKVMGDRLFLNIHVEERPRLSRYSFKGIKKGEAQELKDKINLIKARVVTEATKKEAVVRIQKFYAEKGYGNAKVSVRERPDTTIVNTIILTFDVDKGHKTKINQINIAGNEKATDTRLKRTFRGTKEMPRLTLHPADENSVYEKKPRSFSKYLKEGGLLSPSKTLEALDPYFRFKLFSSSKFNEQKYDDDKQALIGYYNSLGYRDASIEDDTIYAVSNGNLNIDIRVNEGRRYYFGDVTWKGNTKYTDEQLTRALGIRKGDVYNQDLLERRIGRQLSPDGAGDDISSTYMDDGYLFFNIDPVETSIVGDTINYEMRIVEGQQATIKDVTIVGNDRTNEHVIRRELRTLPGNKFSRSDLIRSQREIANLGFFDQEKIGIQPKPHPEDGTVDIEYSVVEKSSDQLQLSAGFGGGVKFYGNIGIQFNNFSLRNVFKPKYWDPLPVGDGQKFSLNYQSNGAFYNSFNASFTEPWLGGRKPNALTTSFVFSRFSGASTVELANTTYIRSVGGGISLSRRLQWPDDNFILTTGINYQNYKLKDYALLADFNNGFSNNLYFKLTLARYSVDQPLYPRSGSNINFTMQITPPFSLFSDRDYSTATQGEKYKWIEYHKYRFTAEWFQKVTGNVVFRFATKYGFMGYYNPDIGSSPFERFQLGGDGLQGQNFFIGRDIIAHRGYEVYDDPKTGQPASFTIFNKYQAELRVPFSLSPTSTIYGLAFVEAANGWYTFKEYNPFKLNRSAGVGVRIFLPMFGLLGLDYGIGFDRYNKATGQTSLKDIARFNFMLGFEPD